MTPVDAAAVGTQAERLQILSLDGGGIAVSIPL
jgi:hypothetical protein